MANLRVKYQFDVRQLAHHDKLIESAIGAAAKVRWRDRHNRFLDFDLSDNQAIEQRLAGLKIPGLEVVHE